MVSILGRPIYAGLVLASTCACAWAQDGAESSSHHWVVQTNFSLAAVSSDLASWVRGGVGKLRYDETDPSLSADRLFLEYTGTISPTLFAHAVVDYQDDGSSGFDATEAYLEWRPVPRSPVRHRLRFGGFYPRLSLENIGSGLGITVLDLVVGNQ